MNFEELCKYTDPLLKVLSGKWFTAPFYERENWLLDVSGFAVQELDNELTELFTHMFEGYRKLEWCPKDLKGKGSHFSNYRLANLPLQ